MKRHSPMNCGTIDEAASVPSSSNGIDALSTPLQQQQLTAG